MRRIIFAARYKIPISQFQSGHPPFNPNHCFFSSGTVDNASVNGTLTGNQRRSSEGSFGSTSISSLSPETDTRWSGLIRLDDKSGRPPHDQPYEEFSGDVEKVYRILRKFHTRVPKLELALQESVLWSAQG